MPVPVPSAEEQFDEGTSRRVEAIYLTPDVAAHREKVLSVLALKIGECVLDIGCGPGLLAQMLAQQVGNRGVIEAVDVSAPMIALARRRCSALSQVRVQRSGAESLPFEDARFDAACVIQVYEYVPDVDRAIGELARVLKPGARAAVMDTDWESAVWSSGNETRMRRVLEAWDTHVPHPRLPRELPSRFRAAGLKLVSCEALPLLNVGYRDDTYSAGMIGVIAEFTAGRNGLTDDDIRQWRDDLLERARRGVYFFSLTRFLFLVEKS